MRKKSTPKKDITPWRLKKVKPLENYKLAVEFKDGLQGLIEMKKFIFNKKSGVFSYLRDISIFNQVYLEYGVVTWPGQIDLAPDAMHDEIQRNGVWIL